MSQRSTEFDGVFLVEGRERPIFSHPPRVKATKYLEDKINDESPVPIPDDKAEEMADWIANMLDRFGAYHARMMFEMLPDGDGNPACSYCGSPHMFCGHGQMSGMPDNEEKTMPDHQQAAIEAAEDALRADQWDGDPEDLPGSMANEAEVAVEAAEPHLRKKWAEEVLKEGILGAGYSVLMNPNRGEHPVTTFTRAVKHMLDLLEGATE